MADSTDEEEELGGGPDPQLLLDELSADTLSALQQHLDSKTAESESSDDEAPSRRRWRPCAPGSVSIAETSSSASGRPVPAHEMPMAMVTP